jgi:hypothetical protein
MHNKNITTPKKCKTCEGSKDWRLLQNILKLREKQQ